jgi:hypothetical protein
VTSPASIAQQTLAKRKMMSAEDDVEEEER